MPSPKSTKSRRKSTIEVFIAVNPNLKDAKIKVGRSLCWNKIKDGQLFYFYGCEGIARKINNDQAFLVDIDTDFTEQRIVHRNNFWNCNKYALPKSLVDQIL